MRKQFGFVADMKDAHSQQSQFQNKSAPQSQAHAEVISVDVASHVTDNETISEFLRLARLPLELEDQLREMGADIAIDLLDLEDDDIGQ